MHTWHTYMYVQHCFHTHHTGIIQEVELFKKINNNIFFIFIKPEFNQTTPLTSCKLLLFILHVKHSYLEGTWQTWMTFIHEQCIPVFYVVPGTCIYTEGKHTCTSRSLFHRPVFSQNPVCFSWPAITLVILVCIGLSKSVINWCA